MIPGLLQLLVFQGIGEALAHFLLPAMPGPVLGLIALVAWLQLRGGPGADLEAVAATFSRHLGVLFVPAAVGVVMFLPQLRAEAVGVLAALAASVVGTLATSAWLLKVLSPTEPEEGNAPLPPPAP